jgi:hypothetical protein
MIRQGGVGTPVADIRRKAGISQATYFNRKKNTPARGQPR